MNVQFSCVDLLSEEYCAQIVIALMAQAAQSPNLKKRSLTNLYNRTPHLAQTRPRKTRPRRPRRLNAIDPEGADGESWSEDWATLYTETGAGTPLALTHPRAKERQAADQKILTNLLRLNQARAVPE